MTKKNITLSTLASLGFFLIMFFWDRPLKLESLMSVGILKGMLYLTISIIFGFGLISSINFKK